MMHYFNSNVMYLEESDFTPEYQLYSAYINPKTGKPFFDEFTVVMVQGNFCGYCTKVKPAFQKLADRYSSQLDFATIQVDGELPSEALFQSDALTYILGEPLEGVPRIMRFYKGRPYDVYNGNDRGYAALEAYIFS